MKILNFKEQNDGSAVIEMELTDTERDFLIEFAINRILEEKLKEMDKENGTI